MGTFLVVTGDWRPGSEIRCGPVRVSELPALKCKRWHPEMVGKSGRDACSVLLSTRLKQPQVNNA